MTRVGYEWASRWGVRYMRGLAGETFRCELMHLPSSISGYGVSMSGYESALHNSVVQFRTTGIDPPSYEEQEDLMARIPRTK